MRPDQLQCEGAIHEALAIARYHMEQMHAEGWGLGAQELQDYKEALELISENLSAHIHNQETAPLKGATNDLLGTLPGR